MVRVAFECFAHALRGRRRGPLSLATLLVLGALLARLLAIGDAAAQLRSKPVLQQREAASSTIPNPYRLNLLIRTTIVAVSQANATGNYSVLRDLAAPRFQIANSHARLADLFAKLRNRKLDLSPILFADPKLTRKPALSPEGILRLTGFIPTRPERLLFDMGFEHIGGTWRLTAILVDVRAAPPEPTAAEPSQRMSPQPVAAEAAANRSTPAEASNNRPRREQKALSPTPLSATPRTELGAPRTGAPMPLPVAKPKQAKAKSGAKAGSKQQAKSAVIQVPWAAQESKDFAAGQAGLQAAPRAEAEQSSANSVAKSLGWPF